MRLFGCCGIKIALLILLQLTPPKALFLQIVPVVAADRAVLPGRRAKCGLIFRRLSGALNNCLPLRCPGALFFLLPSLCRLTLLRGSRPGMICEAIGCPV